MGFIHPDLLWLILVLVPLSIAWSIVRRTRDGRLARFTVRENWSVLNRQVSSRARFHKGALIFLALALSVMAAARPYWGTRERAVKQRGVNVIYAIDVSKSMMATDVMPSRKDYAVQLVRQLLAETPGQRIGIMPFAGEAFLQCPLTTDYGVAQDILKQVDFNTVAYQGTDLMQVVQTAADAFDRTKAGIRALVILTDGEDHSAELEKAATLAAEKEIRIYALGIGSTEGSAIRLPDGRFLEAKDGTKVLSRLDVESLRELAERTKGQAYVAGSSGRFDSGPLVSDIRSLAQEEFGEEKRIIREERYQWPLGLALLCLCFEGLLGERRRDGKSRNRRKEDKA